MYLQFDPTSQKFMVIASDVLWDVIMIPTEVVRFIWDYDQDDQKLNQDPRDVVRVH